MEIINDRIKIINWPGERAQWEEMALPNIKFLRLFCLQAILQDFRDKQSHNVVYLPIFNMRRA